MLIKKAIIRSRLIFISLTLIFLFLLSLFLAEELDKSFSSDIQQLVNSRNKVSTEASKDYTLQNIMIKERMYLVLGTGGIAMFFFLMMTIQNYFRLKSKSFLKRYLSFTALMNSKFHKTNSLSFEQSLNYHFPNLTNYEIELAGLLIEYNNSKIISQKLNISPASVNTARYRIRKKMGLKKSQDLIKFLQDFR